MTRVFIALEDALLVLEGQSSSWKASDQHCWHYLRNQRGVFHQDLTRIMYVGYRLIHTIPMFSLWQSSEGE